MAYIGKSPPATALTSSDIADGIITEAKMADDAISLTELKAGTDGEIISWDASGNPVAIAVGTSGHFLKSQGAGSQPVFAAAGGAWTYISTLTASDSSALEFTSGIDSTYILYRFLLNDIDISANGGQMRIQLYVGGSLQTGSDYFLTGADRNSAGAEYTTNSENQAYFVAGASDMNEDNDENFHGVVNIYNPASTASNGTIDLSFSYVDNNEDNINNYRGAGMINNTGAVTGIKFYHATGNLISGTIRMYGLSPS